MSHLVKTSRIPSWETGTMLSLLCRQNSFISERQSRLSKDTQRVRKNKHHRKPLSNASSVPVPSAQPTHPFTQPWRKCVTVNPERAKKCKE